MLEELEERSYRGARTHKSWEPGRNRGSDFMMITSMSRDDTIDSPCSKLAVSLGESIGIETLTPLLQVWLSLG